MRIRLLDGFTIFFVKNLFTFIHTKTEYNISGNYVTSETDARETG